MTLPLHDQKGNSTLQKYSFSQKYKTQKLRQMTYSSAQTKEAPQKNIISNNFLSKMEHNTHQSLTHV